MKISDLKNILNDMMEPLSVKKVLTVSKDTPKNTTEMLVTYPNPGYHGVGILAGNEEFYWNLYFDGKNWLLNSDPL